MNHLQQKLKQIIKGEVESDFNSREFYSHDASMFELVPEVVAFPKDSEDLQNLVKFVAKNKAVMPHLSITPRSAGTDMSGGAIGQSIVIDYLKYFNKIGPVSKDQAITQPGVFYRDFEVETLKKKCPVSELPC